MENSGTSRLAIKFDLVENSHADFMKAVDEDMLQLVKARGADASQKSTTTGANIIALLEAIVPILDKFSGVSPFIILYFKWVAHERVFDRPTQYYTGLGWCCPLRIK